MSKYLVEGGSRLSGEVMIHGAKNAVLPILAGALLCKECVLHNVPELSDVDAALNILEYLGCEIKREPGSVTVRTSSLLRHDIPDYLMREMRSSVVFLGAIIARRGRARVSLPGGYERRWYRGNPAKALLTTPGLVRNRKYGKPKAAFLLARQ